jgi:hypothetical protein
MLGVHVQIKMIILDRSQLPKDDFMYMRRILCTLHIAVDHYVPLDINIRYINSYLVPPPPIYGSLQYLLRNCLYQTAQLQSSTSSSYTMHCASTTDPAKVSTGINQFCTV